MSNQKEMCAYLRLAFLYVRSNFPITHSEPSICQIKKEWKRFDVNNSKIGCRKMTSRCDFKNNMDNITYIWGLKATRRTLHTVLERHFVKCVFLWFKTVCNSYSAKTQQDATVYQNFIIPCFK